MSTQTAAQEWDAIAALVEENAEELGAMTTHSELYAWAKEQELATKSKFPKFKTEIRKQLDLDYDELRAEAKKRYEEELEAKAEALNAESKDGPRVVLNAAGDAEVNSFAVCKGEKVLWYGTFHPDDKHYDGEQTTADVEAMKKAVWLATKIKEAAKVETLMLELHVCNHEVPKPTGACVKAGLGLEFHLNDQGVPAVDWCRENGFLGWREVALPPLVDM